MKAKRKSVVINMNTDEAHVREYESRQSSTDSSGSPSSDSDQWPSISFKPNEPAFSPVKSFSGHWHNSFDNKKIKFQHLLRFWRKENFTRKYSTDGIYLDETPWYVFYQVSIFDVCNSVPLALHSKGWKHHQCTITVQILNRSQLGWLKIPDC